MTSSAWRVAARIVIEDPKRAGHALEHAFGDQRMNAWRAFLDLFRDERGWMPNGFEEVAIAYCLMAAVIDWDEAEAKRERRDKILNPIPDLDDDDFFNAPTSIDYDCDCAP
jgi:hypothetical protein